MEILTESTQQRHPAIKTETLIIIQTHCHLATKIKTLTSSTPTPSSERFKHHCKTPPSGQIRPYTEEQWDASTERLHSTPFAPDAPIRPATKRYHVTAQCRDATLNSTVDTKTSIVTLKKLILYNIINYNRRKQTLRTLNTEISIDRIMVKVKLIITKKI